MMLKNNKKGFLSVYLCLFFLALVSVTLLIIGGVKSSVVQSNSAALGQLWGQSILAEYDLNLQNRYGLFGYYGYPSLVKKKLEFYAGETFQSSAGKGKNNISWEIDHCSLYDYSLRNVDVFKAQVLTAGKVALTGNSSMATQEIVPVAGHEEGNLQTLFQDLPSEGTKNSFSLEKLTALLEERTSLKGVIKKGSEDYLTMAYAFDVFQHKGSETSSGDRYFQQEIEYIICGKQTELANEKGVKNRIVAVREAMNLIYLNENEKTRNEALAVAELLTPGPAAVATQQTLLSLWALAESVNDYKLLIHGHQVPLMKTEDTWAVDLDSAINNEAEGYIYTGHEAGENYEAYLKFFFYTIEERLRLLRMMDLIQINMRWFYYEEFLLSEYNGGVRFDLTVQGKTHEVVMQYEMEE